MRVRVPLQSLSRICSHETDSRKHVTKEKSCFIKRGYLNYVIQKAMQNVKFSKISSTRKDKAKGALLIVTFHTGLKNIDQIINKTLHLFYVDQEVMKVFKPKPMVSFRSDRKTSSYLVRAKLYPLEKKVGSFNCKCKRCQTCLNVNATNFMIAVWLRKSIKSISLNCNKKCLIYLLTCKVYLKQYVRQTVGEFRLRWNNCKSNNRKQQPLESCMQEHLFEHFNEEGNHGFSEDVSISLIVFLINVAFRSQYWREKLKKVFRNHGLHTFGKKIIIDCLL